jgi:hypothetical protein
METTKSIEIIESMMLESKKSLAHNSFYFIFWGVLLLGAGVAEFFLFGTDNFWIIWPSVGIIGGIISFIYGIKDGKRAGMMTAGDRITAFTWGGFGFTLIFAIIFSLYNHLLPHALVLMLAGLATFISGGISKFKPFVYGAIALEIGAILCAFYIEPPFQGLIFAASMLVGYILPGVLLKKSENG